MKREQAARRIAVLRNVSDFGWDLYIVAEGVRPRSYSLPQPPMVGKHLASTGCNHPAVTTCISGGTEDAASRLFNFDAHHTERV